MEERPKKTPNFIGYDYQDVSISDELETIYLDSYANFGWNLEEVIYRPKGNKNITIRFKRERKIRNKTELTRLQRHFDANLKEIVKMRKQVRMKALLIAVGVGAMGTGFFSGAVIGFLQNTNGLAKIFLILGILGWSLARFLYHYIKDKKRKKIVPLIEMKCKEMYKICEKGKRLL